MINAPRFSAFVPWLSMVLERLEMTIIIRMNHATQKKNPTTNKVELLITQPAPETPEAISWIITAKKNNSVWGVDSRYFEIDFMLIDNNSAFLFKLTVGYVELIYGKSIISIIF